MSQITAGASPLQPKLSSAARTTKKQRELLASPQSSALVIASRIQASHENIIIRRQFRMASWTSTLSWIGIKVLIRAVAAEDVCKQPVSFEMF